MQKTQKNQQYNERLYLIKSPEEALKGLDYPVVQRKDEIMELSESNPSFVLVGETGSGKTTCLPIMLWELKKKLGLRGKIAVTQPRRVAVRSVANRISELVNCKVGGAVGYQVRHEDNTTAGTEINLMTDGILLAKIKSDPLLQEYCIVMIDEAHERSLNIDLCLGLLKEVNKNRLKVGMEPVRIAITSATIEKKKFSDYLDNSSANNSIEIPGRMFPVDVYYEAEAPIDFMSAAANKVKQIIDSGEDGDILVFMPGKEEIDRTIRNITSSVDEKTVDIISLHAGMTPEDQDRIFSKGSKRKIIVSTNIAETSITVPGVKHVIDSGYIKQVEFDTSTGIEKLVLTKHSVSGINQRRGRAGRVAPGKCYRLFPESSLSERLGYQTPEIQRSELSHVVLIMKKTGIGNIEGFDFIDPPDKMAVRKAVQTLRTLGALDNLDNITEVGDLMSQFALDPRLGRMVVEAVKLGCVEDICLIASFVGKRIFYGTNDEKSYTDHPRKKFTNPDDRSDFTIFLNVWDAFIKVRSEERFKPGALREWSHQNFINLQVLNEVQRDVYDLYRVLGRNNIPVNKGIINAHNLEGVGKAITSGLIENLMVKSPFDRFLFRKVRDDAGGIFIHPSSSFFNLLKLPTSLIVSSDISQSPNGKIYVRDVQAVNPNWIPEVAPQLVTEKASTAVFYDETSDLVCREVSLYLSTGSDDRIDLGKKKVEVAGSEAVRVFAEFLVSGPTNIPDELRSIVAKNNRSLRTLIDLSTREEVSSISSNLDYRFSERDLLDFYQKRFQRSDVSSIRALMNEVKNSNLDIIFDISTIISHQKQKEILENNPDEILIGTRKFPVTYYFDPNNLERLASVSFTSPEIFEIGDIPTLPSGRALTIKFTLDGLEILSDNLEELKIRAEEFLLSRMLENYLTQNNIPAETPVDILKLYNREQIDIPKSLVYGVNPRTNQPLEAFASITYDPNKTFDRVYTVKYYTSKSKADEARELALKQIEKKIEQRKQEEEQRSQSAKVYQEYDSLKQLFNSIKGRLGYYWFHKPGLSSISSQIEQLNQQIVQNLSEGMKRIAQLKAELREFEDQEAKKEDTKNKVKRFLDEKFLHCPLCNAQFSGDSCFYSHDAKTVQFEYNEYGVLKGPVVLSRLIVRTKLGDKVVARIMCSDGSRGNGYKGKTYLEKDRDINNAERWSGEPGEVVYEDFDRIKTKEEIAKINIQESLKPLPEGLVKISEDIDGQGNPLFTKFEDGLFRLFSINGQGNVVPFKGDRSKSTGKTVQELIANFFRGNTKDIETAMKLVKDKLPSTNPVTETITSTVPDVDSPMASAFQRATDRASITKKNVQIEPISTIAPVQEKNREERLKELKEKLIQKERSLKNLQEILRKNLETEKSGALNVTEGFTEEDLSKRGVKFIANFDKTDSQGNKYAEVVDAFSNRVLHFKGTNLDGIVYVEVIEQVRKGDFYSKEYSSPGITIKVREVDLIKRDRDIKSLESDIAILKSQISILQDNI
jgi:HrpA-like RNA helicase